MNSPYVLVLAGCVLGLLQLATGVVIGMWLRRSRATPSGADLRRAHILALELHGLTKAMGGSMAAHRQRFAAVHEKLKAHPADQRGPTTELVVGVVGELLEANQELQRELLEAEQRIAEQATAIECHLNSALTDSLTGLPNRRSLDDHLEQQARNHQQHGTPFSLLLLDLDHFKQINDTYGHPTGDDVLVGVAAALRSELHAVGLVARYGGEEFAVVLPGAGLDAARRAVQQARAGVHAAAAEVEQLGFTLTTSGGLAVVEPGEDVGSLLSRSDAALYQAKQSGRNCIYWHDGTRCLRLEEPSGPAGPGAGAMAAARRSPELNAACDDLRSALEAAVHPGGTSA